MASFTKKDLMVFFAEVGINAVKNRVSKAADIIYDKVDKAVSGVRDAADQELQFVELALSVKPRFEELLKEGVDPMRAFKRAVRELQTEVNDEKGGNH